jgi:hypothetical protein
VLLGSFSPAKSSEATGQVRCTSLEAGVKPLKADLIPDKSGWPDKSSGSLWMSVRALWKPVWDRTSPVAPPDKSDESL